MELISLAEREHSIAYEFEAHRPLGQSLFYLGAFAPARHHCARTIALYDPELHGDHVLRYGSDSRIVSTSYEAWALWFLGHPDQSLMRGEAALTLAQELGHPFTLAQTMADTMYLYPLRREVGRTREAAEATISCADEYGFPYWSSIATIHLGWALAMGDDSGAGLARMGAGLAAYRRTGATLALPWSSRCSPRRSGQRGVASSLPRCWTMPWLWSSGRASASMPPSCIGFGARSWASAGRTKRRRPS
jgi:hypothetical protein